jgi:hypothetical protein
MNNMNEMKAYENIFHASVINVGERSLFLATNRSSCEKRGPLK